MNQTTGAYHILFCFFLDSLLVVAFHEVIQIDAVDKGLELFHRRRSLGEMHAVFADRDPLEIEGFLGHLRERRLGRIDVHQAIDFFLAVKHVFPVLFIDGPAPFGTEFRSEVGQATDAAVATAEHDMDEVFIIAGVYNEVREFFLGDFNQLTGMREEFNRVFVADEVFMFQKHIEGDFRCHIITGRTGIVVNEYLAAYLGQDRIIIGFNIFRA